MTEACTAATTEAALWPPLRPRLACHNHVVASRWANLQHAGRLGAGVLAGVAGLAVFVLPQPTEQPPSSYAGQSLAAATLFVTAGLGLTVVGLVTSRTRTTPHLGALAMLAGFLWFAPVWVGWHGGPVLVRSLGVVASAFAVPVILHVVHAFPHGRSGRPASSALITALYVETALSALVLALVRDPFYDPGCWNNCTDNVFLLHSMPGLAHAAQVTDRWFVALAATGFAGMCAWRIATASGRGLRTVIRVAGPGIVLALAIAAHAVTLLIRPMEEVSGRAFLSTFLISCTAAILLSVGLISLEIRTRTQRRAVAQIGSSLGEMSGRGSLASALREAVGDPDLEVAYCLPRSNRFVDANGKPVPEPAASPGRTVTAVVRGGQRIAVLSHTAALSELERQIGAAVRLGLENERLQAEVLARLEELRASRARIVETGDAERRRIERDLHDGVQQRLLALSYDIRLAHTQAEADGDAPTTLLLATAEDEALNALGELRELAHGIYPAILGEAGLGPALATLADAASIPVEIIADIESTRYAEPIETAVYLTAAEAVEDAAGRNAGYAEISVAEADGRLCITVEDDGRSRSSSMVQVADRVGAVGGTLSVQPTSVRAEFPCE
jgi:signal transduction histidine kinase